MSARRWFVLFALAFVLGACGDDDDAPGGAAGQLGPTGKAGTGVQGAGVGGASGRGGSGMVGTSGVSGGMGFAGAAGTSPVAGSGFPAGAGGASTAGMGGTFQPPMCPVTMPQDGSECRGRINCMFGNLQCLCRRGRWTCDLPDPGDMDAGVE